MFTGNYKKRIELFKKSFHKKCLFCEVIVEQGESPTVLNLCEFCLNKYQVIQELKQDKETNKDKESENRIWEIANCFRGKCYFCNELTIKWQVKSKSKYVYGEESFRGEGMLDNEHHRFLHVCKTCYARYNSLCDFEQEKERLEAEQKLQAQIEIPPKSGK